MKFHTFILMFVTSRPRIFMKLRIFLSTAKELEPRKYLFHPFGFIVSSSLWIFFFTFLHIVHFVFFCAFKFSINAYKRSLVMTLDYHDYIDKIWNKFEKKYTYRNSKIHIYCKCIFHRDRHSMRFKYYET